MPSFKTTSLLNNASVATSVGPRPRSVRNIAQLAATAIAISFATLAAPAALAQNHQQQQVINVDRIPATVVSVRNISERPSQYDRRQEQYERRSNRLVETAVGGLVGGLIGDNVGSGSGRRVARTAGAIVGGMAGNRVAQYRDERRNQNQYGNIRQVNDRVMITVDVNLAGRSERYQIEQAAGVQLRRGDAVFLMPANDGRDVTVVPQYSASTYGYGR